MIKRHILTLLWLLGIMTDVSAQQFFNLTADEVRIDSMLPRFSHAVELGADYASAGYDVTIEYPEFIDMSATDVMRYQKIRRDTLPEMPEIDQYVGISRKKATLYLSFIPIVFREGRFQKLVSFKLAVTPKSLARGTRYKARDVDSTRYAAHSVLATGRWAKIRVAETGFHQLTDDIVRQAGFSSASKVRIYGYGGAMQPEKLTADYIKETDDLKELPSAMVNGRRIFWGNGPVSWSSNETLTRTRNPYSDYGYYFITETDEEPILVSGDSLIAAFYPSPSDYHSLYEVEEYSWFHGGRNLYESTPYTIGVARNYTLSSYGTEGKMAITMTYDGPFEATVSVNGEPVGTISATNNPASYNRASVKTWNNFDLGTLQSSNTVTITQTSGSKVRMDYISLYSVEPKARPDLADGTFPTAEYVYNITNQDHHADPTADMVIVIPTTQKVLAQAQRLKELHEQKDSLRVNIVPADELYNEFSSGTPDANAYRRYVKMFYDRAATEADMPRYLLLFGDGAWDNRMHESNWRNYSPDDFLLCYESENSLSETDCYVTDDYFCMLDDDEGGNLKSADKGDVAVGRLTARNDAQAKVLVDKIYSYHNNEQAGAWQNTLCFMADDGNGDDQNQHMNDTEKVANAITSQTSGFMLKKIYWDAYVRQTSATGNNYPDASRLVKQQMRNGALLMNYTGHGSPTQLSHEQVLLLADFETSTSLRLPFWVTASCDTSPFDTTEDNLGETAMMNKNGGAIAFLGTARTVYENLNVKINRAVMRFLFNPANGHLSIAECVRQAKNSLITARTSDERDNSANKLNYVFLGDPAIRLAIPRWTAVVDSINGQPADGQPVTVHAGAHATISGHIEGAADFNGTATISVRDVEQTIVCKQNYVAADEPFVFQDRPNTLYQGSDSVSKGRFNCTFAVPTDISFSDKTGQVLVFAVDNQKSRSAHGENDNFKMMVGEDKSNDGVGPNIYCYLNHASFNNGGTVNSTPFFYAEVSDKDGINASGSGIGHDLELIVDGDVGRTYQLNDYFQYDFGNYQSGSVSYSIPQLSEGSHKLLFRAWDVLNNSSVAELTFVVDPQQEPSISQVVCTRNPAVTSTSFVITHDRAGSQVDVVLEIFDTSGRKLWQYAQSGVSTDQYTTIDWDLTTASGSKLRTGVYLYRVLVSSAGSSQASSAHKLIILAK